MPKRLIDYDGLWYSEKLATVKENFIVEYPWFYGLADAFGCFEINIPAIHSKLSAIRPHLGLGRSKGLSKNFTKGVCFSRGSTQKRRNGTVFGRFH